MNTARPTNIVSELSKPEWLKRLPIQRYEFRFIDGRLRKLPRPTSANNVYNNVMRDIFPSVNINNIVPPVPNRLRIPPPRRRNAYIPPIIPPSVEDNVYSTLPRRSDVSSPESSEDGSVVIIDSNGISPSNSISDSRDSTNTSEEESQPNIIIFPKCFKCKQPNTNDKLQYCSKCWRIKSERQLRPTKKIKNNKSHKGVKNKIRKLNTPGSSFSSSNISHVLSDLCDFCVTKKKNSAFVHGGNAHVCACYSCAVKAWRNNGRCPLCNRKVGNVMKLFF